jgi:hypothetical protein
MGRFVSFLMATNGQFSCPPTGSFRCPLTDAHRLRSRDPQREAFEIGLILNLRSMDLAITSSTRSKPDVALSHYQRDTARALLSGDQEQVLEKQMVATETVVKALVEMKAEVWGEDVRTSMALRSEHVTAEKLITVVSHLASFMFAYSPEHPMHARARSSGQALLRLYGQAAHNEYRDIRALFNAAQQQSLAVAKPTEALKVVKFSGIGEVIIAEVLTRIATDSLSTIKREALPPYIDLYLGGPIPDEARRTLALARAKGLYDRAIAWLRTYGIAKVVRDIAVIQREQVEEVLADRMQHAEEMLCAAIPAPIATSWTRRIPPRSGDGDAITARIHELEDKLESSIVEGILYSDLNSWKNVTKSGARGKAVALLRLIDESRRYLKTPELGLRTDLPPKLSG